MNEWRPSTCLATGRQHRHVRAVVVLVDRMCGSRLGWRRLAKVDFGLAGRCEPDGVLPRILQTPALLDARASAGRVGPRSRYGGAVRRTPKGLLRPCVRAAQAVSASPASRGIIPGMWVFVSGRDRSIGAHGTATEGCPLGGSVSWRLSEARYARTGPQACRAMNDAKASHPCCEAHGVGRQDFAPARIVPAAMSAQQCPPGDVPIIMSVSTMTIKPS
jgi:hypothetical protein